MVVGYVSFKYLVEFGSKTLFPAVFTIVEPREKSDPASRASPRNKPVAVGATIAIVENELRNYNDCCRLAFHIVSSPFLSPDYLGTHGQEEQYGRSCTAKLTVRWTRFLAFRVHQVFCQTGNANEDWGWVMSQHSDICRHNDYLGFFNFTKKPDRFTIQFLCRQTGPQS